jgi:hypothetical protein
MAKPGATRTPIAALVERLSAAVPGGVSCFTLNIDGLWPEACAVHGSIREDNVVLTGTVPEEFTQMAILVPKPKHPPEP